MTFDHFSTSITLVGFGFTDSIDGLPEKVSFGNVKINHARTYKMMLQNTSKCTQNITFLTAKPFSIEPPFSCMISGSESIQQALLRYLPKTHGHGNLKTTGDIKAFCNSKAYHFKCNGSSGKILLEVLGPKEDAGLIFGAAPIGAIAYATILFRNDGQLPIRLKNIAYGYTKPCKSGT